MDYKKVFGLLSVGVVILVAMILFIGPGEVLNALQTADMKYVLLAIIIQFIIMTLWNIKWGIIVSGLDISYKKIPLYAMLLVGLAINNLTPSGRGGGEPVRAYLLSKSSGAGFRKTFATVMSDKLFDTFPFLTLAIIAMIYLIFTLHLSQTMVITLIAVIILFVILLGFILYICFNEELGIRTVAWIFRQLNRFMSRDLTKYESKSKSAMIGFQTSLKYLMKDRKVFFQALIIAFIVWILEILRVYVVFLAFGVNVSFGMIASVFLLSTLVGMIPALPGDIGAVDGIMILVYSMAGVPSSISTAVTLVERLISYWMVSGLGLLVLPYFGTGVLDKVDLEE